MCWRFGMDIEMVARNIQIILAPVVMVTACAILLQGLLARYAQISERLRNLSRERLDLLFAQMTNDGLRAERLRLIDVQIPDLVKHHKFAHDAVLAVYYAVLLFLTSMFAIALAAMLVTEWSARRWH